MKTILITGCLGHLGSHFIRNMKGYNIIGVDNMATQRYSSLFGLKVKNFRFYEMDFIDISCETIREADIIIHFAAITDAAKSKEMKDEVLLTNVYKTKEFINNIVKSSINLSSLGRSLFVFPSTTSVYGKEHPLSSVFGIKEEQSEYINPQSEYAKSKIVIEEHLRTQEKELNHLILRYGTIFGTSPGMRFHTAINIFCWQVALGKGLTVWKQNYAHHRPYLGLVDACNVTKKLMKDESLWNETYNMLSGNYKLSTIITMIEDAVGHKVSIDFIDTPLLNQHSYFVSTEKLTNLGIKTKQDLKTEIKKTLNLLKGLK